MLFYSTGVFESGEGGGHPTPVKLFLKLRMDDQNQDSEREILKQLANERKAIKCGEKQTDIITEVRIPKNKIKIKTKKII